MMKLSELTKDVYMPRYENNYKQLYRLIEINKAKDENMLINLKNSIELYQIENQV